MAVAISRWPPTTVVSLQQTLTELTQLVEEVKRKGSEDADREADWLARLLVVRSCGYLEQVVAEVARGFAEARAGGQIRSFTLSWFPPTRNPSPDQIVKWVGRFDPSWQSELADLLNDEDEELKRELALLLDRRNQIAHGLNERVTVRKALDLKDTAITLADWFILKFDPS